MPVAWFQPGPPEMILIFLVIVLLFGAKKLPGLARALGKSLSEFKKGREEGAKQLDDDSAEPTPIPPSAAETEEKKDPPA